MKITPKELFKIAREFSYLERDKVELHRDLAVEYEENWKLEDENKDLKEALLRCNLLADSVEQCARRTP